MTTVIINDYITTGQIVILFSSPDFEQAERNWENEDRLLVELSTTESFYDRRRWCDLSPNHYRFLIMNNLKKVSDLDDIEQQNPDNLTVASLTFLLTAFIKCLEITTESNIDMLRITRIGEYEIIFDFTSCININFDTPKKPKLRVIVDNT